MPVEDARRWNARYREREAKPLPGPHTLLVEHAHLLPGHGLALDVAMGLGGDAGFLLARGMRVIGVDISLVAVCRAKARWPALQAVVADLTRFHLPPASFDVILNFYYLQRDLWPAYHRALRPGGLLFFETYLQEELACEPQRINPAYLLSAGELPKAFGGLEILFYRQYQRPVQGGPTRGIASLIARAR